MFRLYLRIADRLSHWGWVAAQALTALAIIICCGNALSRKFLDYSSNALLEAQWYCFGAAFLLAGAKVMADNAHVRVDVIASRLPPRRRHHIELAGLLLCVLPFCGLMVAWAWPFFVEAWARNEVSSDAGGLIRWPVKLMIPLAFTLLGLQAGARILRTVEALRSSERTPRPEIAP